MIKNYPDHAANERTFLAWVRTSIAIVGFGLLIARVGSVAPLPGVLTGVLLAFGMLLILFSVIRFHHIRKWIESPDTRSVSHSHAETLLAIKLCMLMLSLVAFVLHGVMY